MTPAFTIPILMYHKVGQPVAQPGDRFLNIAAVSFESQMRLLSRLGYRARPFVEVVEAITRGKTLPRRVFAITFDDGYCNVGEVAAPILARFGFPATVFVVSQGVGRMNVWDQAEGKPQLPLLGWEALRALSAQGWEIGGHTRFHPHLDVLDDAIAYADILEGKRETEAQLGVTLHTFCYPFGHFNVRTPALVRAAGFQGACTTRSGLACMTCDPFTLSRVKIAYRDGMVGLLYRLFARPHLPNARPHRRQVIQARSEG